MALLRAVAWLLRFKSYMLVVKESNPDRTMQGGCLKVIDLKQAERDVVRLVQKDVYSEILLHLEHSGEGGITHTKLGSLSKLNPILNDGLICVGGRLSYSRNLHTTKYPPILPQKHIVSDLIIRYYHVTEGHCGVAHVLSTIRACFWIAQGGAAVKRVIGGCIKCRRQNALPCKQIMSPLPCA